MEGRVKAGRRKVDDSANGRVHDAGAHLMSTPGARWGAASPRGMATRHER